MAAVIWSWAYTGAELSREYSELTEREGDIDGAPKMVLGSQGRVQRCAGRFGFEQGRRNGARLCRIGTGVPKTVVFAPHQPGGAKANPGWRSPRFALAWSMVGLRRGRILEIRGEAHRLQNRPGQRGVRRRRRLRGRLPGRRHR